MTQRSPLVTFLVAALAVGALVLALRQILLPELREQRLVLERLVEKVQKLEEATQFQRFEKGPGTGFSAVLDHLRFWSGQKAKMGGSVVERPVIRSHLKEGEDALLSLGSSGFDHVASAFLAARSEGEDDLRDVLLDVLCRLDSQRGALFAEKCLRRQIETQVSPRMRLLAADQLMKIDLSRAGEVLKDILSTEYTRGLQVGRTLPVGDAPPIERSENPGFFNFVSRFMRTSYPQKKNVLNEMLNNPIHDLTTLIEVVDGLGEEKSMEAVDKLKEFFETRERPPYSNPMFRIHCVQAVANILGPESCNWLKQMLTQEGNEPVRRKIEYLVRETCR